MNCLESCIALWSQKSDRLKPTWFNLLLHQVLCSPDKVGSQTDGSTIAGHTKIRQGSAAGLAAGVASLKNCQKLAHPAEFTWQHSPGWSWASSCTSSQTHADWFFFSCFLKKKPQNQTKHLLFSVMKIDSGLDYTWLYIKWKSKHCRQNPDPRGSETFLYSKR